MRTALFFVALAIRDVAEALGKVPLNDLGNVLLWFMLVMMTMDVVDFMRGKK